jgi:DNA-cytosine methyltransferase
MIYKVRNMISATKNIIRISDFLKKNIEKKILEVYGPEDLDENNNVISFSDQIALVTHYAMLHDDNHNRIPYERAVDVVKGWYYWIGQDIDAVREKDNELIADSADAFQTYLFNDLFDVPFPTPTNPRFTFIDLFAGIGGFRMAMQNLGGKCVYSSEWDEQAKKTYFANYGEVPFGDITKESTKSFIPDGFDVLCAGFPCQAFSLAGKRRGFNETRGTLFFDVAEILRRKQPKAIFLENVKGLKIHDKGKTFDVIKNTLREVGYIIADDPAIVNAMFFGVPQHRERVYIIGVRNDIANQLGITNETIRDSYPNQNFQNGVRPRFIDIREEKEVSVKYYLSTQYMQTLINHKARHAAKGNGFGYEIIPDDGISNAIVVGGMGRERNLVIDDRLTNFVPITKIKGKVNRDGIRRMTPREWARLQGYPDNFIIPVADASAYKQFGNSVAVPAIQATANNLLELINPML